MCSWTCGFIIFNIFGKHLAIISPNTCLLSLSCGSSIICVRLVDTNYSQLIETLFLPIFCFFFFLTFFVDWFLERGRKRELDLLLHFLTHSLVDPCMSPDWGSNSQPWEGGRTHYNPLSYQARQGLCFILLVEITLELPFVLFLYLPFFLSCSYFLLCLEQMAHMHIMAV